MKKTIFSILIGLVFVGGIVTDRAPAQEPTEPTNLGVALFLTGSTFLLGVPDDPINFVISLGNVPLSGDPQEDVITSEGFSARDFHLLLYFTYIGPDGVEEHITATNPGYVDEPEPPRRAPNTGEQVEPVEILGPAWILNFKPFDARIYYPLTRAGKYSVKVVISLKTYPPDTVVSYISGAPYVPMGTAAWSGDIVSNTIYFR